MITPKKKKKNNQKKKKLALSIYFCVFFGDFNIPDKTNVLVNLSEFQVRVNTRCFFYLVTILDDFIAYALPFCFRNLFPLALLKWLNPRPNLWRIILHDDTSHVIFFFYLFSFSFLRGARLVNARSNTEHE